MEAADQTGIILISALASLVTGYLFGIYTVRGYIIPPSLSEERRRNKTDPVESEESDVDELDSLLDHAPNWANGPDADRKQGLRALASGKAPANKARGEAADEEDEEECKLVLVVRTDLGMTKGKIAAQCSHATLACYRRLLAADTKGLLARWEREGQAKIALQVKSQEGVMELRGRARELGLTAEVVRDAGRTQIEAGSVTVLGVGPGPKSLVDKVTGGLKLL